MPGDCHGDIKSMGFEIRNLSLILDSLIYQLCDLNQVN